MKIIKGSKNPFMFSFYIFTSKSPVHIAVNLKNPPNSLSLE